MPIPRARDLRAIPRVGQRGPGSARSPWLSTILLALALTSGCDGSGGGGGADAGADDGGGGLSAAGCDVIWRGERIWRIFLVIPALTGLEGQVFAVRTDGAAAAPNARTCVTLTEWDTTGIATYSVDCTGLDPLEGEANLDADRFLITFPSFELDGAPDGNCFAASGVATSMGESGTFLARVIR